MSISSKYVALAKYTEPKKEGYQPVEIQDNFIYKGVIHELPDQPVYLSNQQLVIGDIVMFAKYSPDTHEIEENGEKVKYVSVEDLLKVL